MAGMRSSMPETSSKESWGIVIECCAMGNLHLLCFIDKKLPSIVLYCIDEGSVVRHTCGGRCAAVDESLPCLQPRWLQSLASLTSSAPVSRK